MDDKLRRIISLGRQQGKTMSILTKQAYEALPPEKYHEFINKLKDQGLLINYRK